MNWNKLPVHRRKVLMLRDWRHETDWIWNSQWFQHNMCPDYEGERVDDNNTDFPCK